MSDTIVEVDVGGDSRIGVVLSEDLEVFDYTPEQVMGVLTEYPVNSGYLHEIMDRLHNLSRTIQEHVDFHPAFMYSSVLQTEVSKAITHLENAYQYAGALTVKFPTEYECIVELLDKEVAENNLSGYSEITCPKLKFLINKVGVYDKRD